MERRQHRQHALLAIPQRLFAGPHRLPILRVRRREIGVRQHRAFRQARGAAGILQHRDGFGGLADGMRNRLVGAAEEIAERDDAFAVGDGAELIALLHLRAHHVRRGRELREFADDQRLEPRLRQQSLHLREQRGEIERDENVGAAVLDLVFEHALGVERRIVDDDAAGFHHAEERDHVMRRVGQIEADMHAGADAELLQARGEAVGQRVQLGVADAPAHEFERRQVGEALGRAFEHGLHGAGEDAARPSARPAGTISASAGSQSKRRFLS